MRLRKPESKVAICFLIVLLFFPLTDAFAKKVLIIHSYHPEMPWAKNNVDSIINTFGPSYEVDVFYMDTKRKPASEFPELAEAAWERYLSFKPDLVMTGDDNALKFLGPKLAETDTPVIFFAVNNNPRFYFKNHKLPPNITGIIERIFVKHLARELPKIIGNLKNVLVMFDGSHSAQANINMIFEGYEKRSIMGVEFSRHNSSKFEDWKKAVALAQSKSNLLVLVNYYTLTDEEGNYVFHDDVLRWTSENSDVPVFGILAATVHSEGGFGAYVLEGETHGRMAAEAAIKVLEGKVEIRRIPPESDRNGVFYFNRDQLKRFNFTVPDKIAESAKYR